MELCLRGIARESVIYKVHIASRILSGMEKGTPLREETSSLGSESDEEERIVGSETLSTSSRELNDISDSPVLHTVDTSVSRYGRKRTRVFRVSDSYVPWQSKKKKERKSE